MRWAPTGVPFTRVALTAAFAVLTVGLAGCKGSPHPSAGFGVNLIIHLDAGARPQARSVLLQVAGAEAFNQVLEIAAFPSNEARVRYVPSVTEGMLTFTGQARDASLNVLARGQVQVTLVKDKAVSATLDLLPGGTPDGGTDLAIDSALDSSPGDVSEAGDDAETADVPPIDSNVPGKKGESCAGGRACAAGLTCANNVCCDGACAGPCSACNLAGREGTCSPVPAGTAPPTGSAACTPGDASTCQRDGTCDGEGACRLWPQGTICRASRCDLATDGFTPEFKCDGKGVCEPNLPISCAPFKCKDATACHSTCTDASQCVTNRACLNNSCGLKPDGAACTQGVECSAGNCAGGVCCDKPCQAGCESCDLGAMRGTCTNVAAGNDPKGICPAGSAENATCSPGGCAGTGGTTCRKAATTTTCRVGSCVNGTAINPATCLAGGTCPPIAQSQCGPFSCGATSCNTTCAGDGDCSTGNYCALAPRSCQARKTAGVGCSASNECQSGLTCVDGVCCTTPACPSCRNCGGTGSCSVLVASAEDTTGTTCSGTRSCNASGSCLSVAGQSCGSGTGCVTGNCVDGVCCTAPSCGACRNCGATGACSVTVANTDDISDMSCALDQSCDPAGACKQRWSLVNRVATVEGPDAEFSVGLGNLIFFANPNNSGGGAHFFKSFNVATLTAADESKVLDPLCACGFGGTLVGQPLDGRLYYAGNDARFYSAGGLTWTNFVGGYPSSRGEAATAVLGKRIYYVGGRGALASVQAYDTTLNQWTTAGITDAPAGIDSGCAGASGGVVYVFGGRANAPMMAYTEATNKWTTISPDKVGCFGRSAPLWRGKLVLADFDLKLFNTTTQKWETSVPLPDLTANQGWFPVVAGAANDLYVVSWAGGSTYIYKWVFN